MNVSPMFSRSVLRFGHFPVWRDSKRADTPAAPVPRPIPKRDAVRLYHQARELERRTRAPGHQDGKITRNGLAVLHALVFDFCNWQNGRCDPDYANIAEKAAISVRSVARGLAALKKSGVLVWVRRCIESSDQYGRFCLKQISNAYAFVTRSLAAPVPESGTWGNHPNDGDALGTVSAALATGVHPDGVLYTLECDGALGGALARLWRQNAGRL